MQSRDPEMLIQQALRAQAGGPRRTVSDGIAPVQSGGHGGGWLDRFTATQIVLLAVIAGIVIGMAAGFAVLLAD